MARSAREKTLIEAATELARGKTDSRVKDLKLAADALVLPVMLAEAKLNGAAGDGGWPTQAEFATYWGGMHRRTAERYWARYREVFGTDADPQALAAVLLSDYAERIQRREQAFVFSAPGRLLQLA
jgi:hypothetical protein